MAPDTQANTNSLVSQAQANGSALQNQYNSQSSNLYNQYNTNNAQATGAYNNLLNYTQNMQSPSQMYGQDLTNAQSQYGFNPQDLLKANQALAQTQDTLNMLPQAAQQQGNYYGTTSGATANNYANMASNVNGVLGNQTNAVNAFQNVLGATQNQANQQATLGYQGQQLQSQNYQALYQQAVTQMQTSGQTLSQIEGLQQQQGYLTAEQTAAYQNAYSTYLQSSAQANLANQQAQQQSMQNTQTSAYMNSAAYQNYLKYGSTAVPGAAATTAGAPAAASNTTGSSGGGLSLSTILNPFKDFATSL